MSWIRRAIAQQSEMSVRGPGSKSKTTARGVSRSAASAIGACSSIAAMLPAHTIAAGSSMQQYSMPPLRSPGPRATATHPGRWFGHRFSKKPCLSVPSGISLERQRPPPQMGNGSRCDTGHVVDDLALGEPGRVQDLVEVGQLQLAPVDLGDDLAAFGHRIAVGYAVFLALAVLFFAVGWRCARRLGRLDAGFQRRHQVDDLRLLGRHLRHLELLAGGLLGDQLEDLFAVVVAVLLRLEGAGQGLHERLGHLHLALATRRRRRSRPARRSTRSATTSSA